MAEADHDPITGTPRLTGRAFPPYAYVPGAAPHPFRHPAGHLWSGGGPPQPEPWFEGPWQHDEAFLWGVDLFHAAYFWEAHEVWEGTWRQVPRGDDRSVMLQALIQGAAAQVKRRQGDARAAASLTGRATERLAGLQGRVLGLDPRQVAQAFAQATPRLELA